jgi:hypothetical protein
MAGMEYHFLQLDVQLLAALKFIHDIGGGSGVGGGASARAEFLGIAQVALDQPGLRLDQAEMGGRERDQDRHRGATQQ